MVMTANAAPLRMNPRKPRALRSATGGQLLFGSLFQLRTSLPEYARTGPEVRGVPDFSCGCVRPLQVLLEVTLTREPDRTVSAAVGDPPRTSAWFRRGSFSQHS